MILVIVNVVEKAVSREITNLWRFIIVTPETNSIQQFLSPVLTAYSLVVLRQREIQNVYYERNDKRVHDIETCKTALEMVKTLQHEQKGC